MDPSRTRPVRGSARFTRSLLPFNWGMLLLFLLFTLVIGVREAQAQPEMTIAGCVVACSGAFRDLKATTFCGACIIWGGRILRHHVLGESEIAGYGCAKANIGC
jgi:hypothetical protein